jgi:prepilin-type N-terminal cleavage/methylation domain-containing protein
MMPRSSSGFTLIELLAGLVISALLIVTITNLFYQLSLTVKSVETIADLDQNSVIALHQISKDLGGAYMPALRAPVQKDEKTTSTAQEQQKPVEKAFFATEKDKRFNLLTFITTSPLTRFVAPVAGAMPKPQLVRVMYQLQEQKEKKGKEALYTLLRTEGDLVIDPKKKLRPLAVVTNLKLCAFEFKYTTTVDVKPGQTMKSQPVWSSDAAFEPNAKLPPFPELVQLKLILWDNALERERSYEFLIPISCYQQAIQVQKPPKQTEQQQMKQAQQQQGGQGKRPPFRFGFRINPSFMERYVGKRA